MEIQNEAQFVFAFWDHPQRTHNKRLLRDCQTSTRLDESLHGLSNKRGMLESGRVVVGITRRGRRPIGPRELISNIQAISGHSSSLRLNKMPKQQ